MTLIKTSFYKRKLFYILLPTSIFLELCGTSHHEVLTSIFNKAIYKYITRFVNKQTEDIWQIAKWQELFKNKSTSVRDLETKLVLENVSVSQKFLHTFSIREALGLIVL